MMGKSLVAVLATTVVLIVVCMEGGKHVIGTEKGHGADILLQAKSTPHDLHFTNVSQVIFLCDFSRWLLLDTPKP